MVSVGVRELRQRASELLRRVERGEVIAVTDRGRAVAMLSPPPEGSPIERLRACGDVETAAGDIEDLPAPIVLPPGIERPSTVLARLRRDER
jgi:prevent-host-death family protein